jgi:type IV secretory pathway VirB10-like protein
MSHLVNFGGFRDGQAKQNKPITPTKIMGIKSNQLMPPPTSKANPPTLPSHQNCEATGRESDIRATKNDKAATENITNPSLRRLMLINVKPPNEKS